VSDSFHVEGAEIVFRSHVFNVEKRTVRHGDDHFERDVAVHPGAVAVLVINEDGEVGFIRQYRATFDQELLEIPAGTQDIAGEEPLEAAKRELIEEMGIEASEWTLIGRFMNSPGWSTQVMTVYEARGLTVREREPAGAEERSSTIHWYSPTELRTRLRSAYAIDSTTTIALHRVFGNFLDEL
jgi:8-oxo-dGTP pyrophosphatase MutT (NUDIX family)